MQFEENCIEGQNCKANKEQPQLRANKTSLIGFAFYGELVPRAFNCIYINYVPKCKN
jgi:hypothetical protein